MSFPLFLSLPLSFSGLTSPKCSPFQYQSTFYQPKNIQIPHGLWKGMDWLWFLWQWRWWWPERALLLACSALSGPLWERALVFPPVSSCAINTHWEHLEIFNFPHLCQKFYFKNYCSKLKIVLSYFPQHSLYFYYIKNYKIFLLFFFTLKFSQGIWKYVSILAQKQEEGVFF